ncbi:MAG: hypothetical protein ACK4VO_02940 [Pseudobdellovibrio sp.]
MEKTVCPFCQKSKNLQSCEACHEIVCKNCAQFVSEATFKFSQTLLQKKFHQVYCPTCFNNEVADHVNQYENTVEKAKEIAVFDISQSKETRLIKRLEKAFKLENETDEEDAIMKLAYLAAEKGFNAIIDVDIKPTKVRDGSYQTTIYTCTAIPAQVTDRKLIKDRSLRSYPN